MKDPIERQAAIQPEQQHGRVFKGVVVEYPSYNIYPEYIGKPYFSIKYTENGQEFIGYRTYKPEVLSEYLKEYFMPSAQPEQRWIPCSERLPERGKDVLVTRDYDGREDSNKSCRYVEVAGCFGEDDDISWCSFSDEYKMKPKNHHVIAWMPLPEPYGGDQNG